MSGVKGKSPLKINLYYTDREVETAVSPVSLMFSDVGALMGYSDVGALTGHSDVGALMGHSDVDALTGLSDVDALTGYFDALERVVKSSALVSKRLMDTC